MELNLTLKDRLISASLYMSYTWRCAGIVGYQAVVQYYDAKDQTYYTIEGFGDAQEIGKQVMNGDQKMIFIDTTSDTALSASIASAVYDLEHPPELRVDPTDII